MNTKRFACAVLLTGAAATANAQTGPADTLTGTAALGYLATSGNTESTNANSRFALTYDPASQWLYRFTLAAVGASREEETTAESYSVVHRSQRDFSDHNYVFGLVDWKKDRFSGYDQQISETVGFGRRIIDMDRHVLSLEGGAGAKQATQIDGTEQDEGIVRGGLEYVLDINDTTDFSQALVIEIGDNNRYSESISELSTRVIGNISLVLSYTIKNNSDVPPDSTERDTFTSIALEYAF